MKTEEQTDLVYEALGKAKVRTVSRLAVNCRGENYANDLS